MPGSRAAENRTVEAAGGDSGLMPAALWRKER